MYDLLFVECEQDPRRSTLCVCLAPIRLEAEFPILMSDREYVWGVGNVALVHMLVPNALSWPTCETAHTGVAMGVLV